MRNYCRKIERGRHVWEYDTSTNKTPLCYQHPYLAVYEGPLINDVHSSQAGTGFPESNESTYWRKVSKANQVSRVCNMGYWVLNPDVICGCVLTHSTALQRVTLIRICTGTYVGWPHLIELPPHRGIWRTSSSAPFVWALQRATSTNVLADTWLARSATTVSRGP